jgi:phosphoglycerate dehydrogenase-like enzyme
MDVVAFDVTEPTEADAALGIRRVGFDELLTLADVVSLHMPLIPATRGLFNREVFARMRPGSYLINTARGGVLVESDLHDALASGHLAGAGLDVMDPEPPRAGHPLFQLPNVVISPHIAGIDTKSMADMAELAARCIADLHAGRWPEPCVVNPAVRPGWRW